MSYQDRIRDARPGLSKSFARLADYLLDSYIEVAFMTATELANQLGIDAATVVRFSQHLGFTGYPELLREVQEHVKHDILVQYRQPDERDTVPGIVATAIDELRSALALTQISLNTAALADLVNLVGKARRILILAEGPAQPAAYNLVYYLEQGNFPVQVARPGLAGLARTLHTATGKDIMIAFDIAGETPYLAPALREARAGGITTVSITSAPSLASAQSADIVLAAHASPELGVGIITVEAITYLLVKALRQAYPDHFAGVEQEITELTSLLQ
jgi:DNA-binding MurR/RpiR family transcriptional regulator